tara:strand:+ start:75 stop:293 length:219 start_codon:yes stop_codon:yes gene_type:complete
MSPIELTLFTLSCTFCAYLWGKHQSEVSVENVSLALIEILAKDGYIKIDENDNLVKVNDEMVDNNDITSKDN